MVDLVGRRTEREAVERLLADARAGRSGALTVRGEAGVGKTALLEYARTVADGSGFRVESAVGVEAETQFAFGALHHFLAPVLGRVGSLPEPQQTALRVAFGQQAGAAPDRFLIGLAVLNLLAEVAEERPLLCLVDDAQWLDEASAQVLAFVARRVVAEDVALLFSLRDPTDDGDLRAFAGLPELTLRGLPDSDARALLVTGVFRYANTWPTAIALVAAGQVRLDPLVTGHFRLDQTAEALTAASDDPHAIKSMIHPQT